MRRSSLIAVAVLGISAVTAAAAVVGIRTGEPLVKFPTTAAEVIVGVPEGKDRSDLDACLLQQDGAALVACTKELLMRNARLGKYATALGQLHEAVQRNTDVMAACHAYAHDIGKLAYDQGMPLAEVYKVGWNDCRLGFPHGALQLASAGLTKDTIAGSFEKLCGDMGAFGLAAQGDCVHLIGHVIADLYGKDLEGGTKACAGARQDHLWGRCMHGLLMRNSEYVIAAGAAGATDAEKRLAVEIWGTDRTAQRELLVHVCRDLVNGPVVGVCSNSIPTVLAVLWDYDWPAIHTACGDFEGDARDLCYQGIAGSAVANKGWSVEQVKPACEAGVGRVECFRSAGSVYGSARPEGNPDEPLCGILTGADQEACREGFAAGVRLAGELTGDTEPTQGEPRNETAAASSS